MVAWESDGQDGDQSGIFARSYTPFGVPGPEFQVNTYTTSAQHAPSVGGANSFSVIAWQSEGQDGDLAGIYARRFDGASPPAGFGKAVQTWSNLREMMGNTWGSTYLPESYVAFALPLAELIPRPRTSH